ncbi:uncharacterized protein LOC124259721 [Haliotis rubra]|uniref:uncharacterized protein LOC124259721 n=1 Tax=Haliotis rubra TaxID=36100 RepID=UPI001EE5EAE1|nr:uncharacterized protein LOC124259721 [Haliotis rubra]
MSELTAEYMDKVGVELAPSEIQIHFEVSAIRAVEEIYEDCEVRGCFFHFTQAVWRKVAEKGLTNDYKDIPQVQAYIRRAAALPLLPRDMVQDTWIAAMNEGPESEKVRNFNDYVTSTWVDYETRFPVRIWTQYGNNHLEGWHLKLKNLIAKAHPNIYLFVANIKKIEVIDKAKRAQLDCGVLPKSRKRVYRDF